MQWSYKSESNHFWDISTEGAEIIKTDESKCWKWIKKERHKQTKKKAQKEQIVTGNSTKK